MLNTFNALVAAIIITLFVGGLAHSIWEGTGSIAFPIIAVVVLIMVFIDAWQNMRDANIKDNK